MTNIKDIESVEETQATDIKKPRVTKIDELIGLRLQAFREKFNITQTELGNAIGVTFQQIQKYEKGTNRIHAEVIWRIAYIFNIDIYFFFPISNDSSMIAKTNVNIGEIPHDDRQSLNLVKAYLELKDVNVRKKVMNLISSIIDSESEDETESK